MLEDVTELGGDEVGWEGRVEGEVGDLSRDRAGVGFGIAVVRNDPPVVRGCDKCPFFFAAVGDEFTAEEGLRRSGIIRGDGAFIFAAVGTKLVTEFRARLDAGVGSETISRKYNTLFLAAAWDKLCSELRLSLSNPIPNSRSRSSGSKVCPFLFTAPGNKLCSKVGFSPGSRSKISAFFLSAPRDEFTPKV